MTICEELEELVPAYVLDAVDDQERARIEAHLPHCANCTRLIAEYRPIVDELALSVPQVDPPAHLKYRVLAAAVPPQVAPSVTAAPARGVAFSSLFSNLFRSPVFSAAVLVLVVALGIWNLSLQNQIAQQAAATQQVAADLARQREFSLVMAAWNTSTKNLQGTEVSARSWGRLYGGAGETTLALLTYDLPVLEPSKVYQLWLIEANGERTSGGTFTVNDQGIGWLLIRSPRPLNQYQGVGITIEPAGGSPKPTGPKMMGTNL